MTYHHSGFAAFSRVALSNSLAETRCRSFLGRFASLALPQAQDIVGDHVQVRFLRIGVDADLVLAAIRQPELIIAGLGKLERLGGGGLMPRVSGAACLRGPCDLDALAACSLGSAEFEIGVHQLGAALAFAARKIARGLLDEGNEGGAQGKIVREVVEPGGEKHDASLADLFLQQQRRLVA